MPDLAVGDVLEGVRREVERAALRARNGIKYLRAGQWGPLEPTPSETVWAQDKARLRHYRSDHRVRWQPPVLAFIGLVNRSSIFDLWQGSSIVRLLMEAGFDVFVLDWGEPDETDAANTLETYLQGYLPRAIKAVGQESGAEEVSLLGYCMGGCMALHGLAAQPELPVRNLVLMATPVDFRRMGLLVESLASGRIDPDELMDETGTVPAALIRQGFKSRKPTADLVTYANLWQHLWNDEYMEGFQALRRWLHDHIPMPGGVFSQVVESWIRGNAFLNDNLRLGGRRAPLGAIDVPTLAVIAERDELTPEPATTPIVDVLTGTKVETLRVDAGHVSLSCGRKAVGVLLPQIFDWLAAHSEESQ